MKKRNREINIFSVSFLDVLANTIGGLAFLLIFAVLLMGFRIGLTAPQITTEALADGYHEQNYLTWLAAREGLGKFTWSFGGGEYPPGLELEPETGKLSGVIRLSPPDGNQKDFEFTVKSETKTDEAALQDERKFKLTVRRQRLVDTVPLRVVTEENLPVAYLEQTYPLAFAAEGGQAPYRWAANLPPGLSLTADGKVTGSPAQAGKFNFSVSVATPQGEQQTQSFALTVSRNYPPPPDIPPLRALTRRVPPAVAERDYTVQLAAAGGYAPYTWTAVSGAPAWLQNSPDVAAAFSGKPALADVGRQRVVWQVSDSKGQTARTEAVDLEVLPPVTDRPPPLRIKTPPLPEGRAGQPYALALAVEGGFPPYVWEPADFGGGLSLAASEGVLSGTPERAGELRLPVSVSDRAGQKASAELSLKVRPPLLPVKILTQDVAVGRAGQPFTLTLSAVGGYAPYRWQLVGGEWPAGLSLAETGQVAGTPAQPGHWEARVNLTDAEGQTAEPLLLKLEALTPEGAHPLVIKTKSLPTLLAGQAADVTLACEGGTPPYAWRADGGLPDGLQIEQDRIIGNPSAGGAYQAALRVTDATGQSATVSYPLRVRRVAPYWLWLLAVLLVLAVLALVWLWRAYARRKPQPLSIISQEIPNARASAPYSVQLACAGGVPPYTWRVVTGKLPPEMELSADGKLSGHPFEGIGVDKTLEISFTVEVEDANGATARQEL
jgi:hypothetical protein